MTEEEFNNYYQHGFRGGHKVNNGETKWNGKVRYFESYTFQNGRWNETTLDKLKTDINDLPKIKKSKEGLFWWVEKKGRDYYINKFPLVGLLYDHINNRFLYLTPWAVISEEMICASEEECNKWIQDEEEKHKGEITIKTKEQVEAEEAARGFGGSPFGDGFESFSQNGNTKSWTFRF